jgi:exodeoxyribonuclease VII large subunit
VPGRVLSNPSEPTDVVSVGELLEEVRAAIEARFPPERYLWVRGEVQKWTDRTGHCYIDLVDPEASGSRIPVLKVKCWQSYWGPLKARLAEHGLTLEAGTVITICGVLDFYEPRSEVGFVMYDLDVEGLLGQRELARRRLLEELRRLGLDAKNRGLPLPALPLRVGLVASPGTEGYKDFLGQLLRSGFGFRVLVAPASVQGERAPASIVAALCALRAEDVDLVAVVRGGGSKLDLIAFDDRQVAFAIAEMPVPVFTGIGHTGDESVADVVAARALATPTKCGEEIVALVAEAWESARARAQAVAKYASQLLERAEEHQAATARRLAFSVGHQARLAQSRLVERVKQLRRAPIAALDRTHDALVAAAVRLRALAPRALDGASVALGQAAKRTPALTQRHLRRADERLGTLRRLLKAYDLQSQLRRGWSLTYLEGRLVRSVEAVEPGSTLCTRVVDGAVHSVVSARHRREGG